ncbi:MAG: DUF4124 domain-containing protein [Gammaproteobacteria bacterium]|nr:DUF4124 domain-containing protein [Gammaproteobacteria bacterium]
MLKWILRLAIPAALVAALAAPFFLNAPNGKPVMKLPAFEDLVPIPGTPSPGDLQLVYKWRDAQGQVHYSDQPPADTPWETLTVDPGTNVIPAVKPREPEPVASVNPALPAQTPAAPDTSPAMIPGLTANPVEVLEKARQAREALENRPLPP